MPTISAKISKKEHDAIVEFANVCGETVSNLVRKVMLTEATFMNGYHDSMDYHYEITVLDNVLGEEEDRIVLSAYNKIRRILGLKEQDEI